MFYEKKDNTRPTLKFKNRTVKMASLRISPASDVPSENVLGTLTIRDKSLLKRNINRHHNNNTR